jgi:hypothetical protein
MKKHLLICTFAAALMWAVTPVQAATLALVAPGIEQVVDDEVTISVNEQTVYINGAQGQVLDVISLTGRSVQSMKIDSPAQKVELNVPKGCYILKVGKVVRKVSVR